MKIHLRGRNIEITPALQEYVEKRLNRMEKFFNSPIEAHVALSVIREDHIVEVTLSMGGLLLRGEEATLDMYASIDQVVDKLERQMRKYKTRINRKLRQRGIKEINERLLPPALEEEKAEEDRIVVKRKRFVIKPMPVEEATLQMNLLGHDFFVFSNSETEEINVLYKRKDGNYGLIEPTE